MQNQSVFVVLAANRPHPSSKTLPFQMSDPRLVFVIKSFDPRVHFAITFGAKVRVIYSTQLVIFILCSLVRQFDSCSWQVVI